MPDGSLPVEVVRGVHVVTAPEHIDITNAAGLRAAVLQAAAHGHGTVVIDMTGTRFCDSAGLHVLVSAHKRARSESGQVLLVIADAAVLHIFAITALDRVIPNVTSLDEALAQTPAGTAGPGSPARLARAVLQAHQLQDPAQRRTRRPDDDRAAAGHQVTPVGARAQAQSAKISPDRSNT